MIKPCIIGLRKDESAVNPHLSMTPSQMMQMSQQGRAVSQASLENVSYYDAGTSKASPSEMPLENRRGVDMNDLWQAGKRAKEKMRKFEKFAQDVL